MSRICRKELRKVTSVCRGSIAAVLGVLLLSPAICPAQPGLDDAPIRYPLTKGNNPVTDLFAKIDAGETQLQYEPGFGQLRSLLDELQIPISSQSLVFSQTSLQSARISPANPRAIYFNDDVYVGWVRGSSLLEISTADPLLGAAFYTVQMTPRRAITRRENGRCLACHETYTPEGQVPIHTIRSVMTRPSGKINLLLDSYITGHASPLSERWGGWYVSGSSGESTHLGNSFLEGDKLVPHGTANRDDLTGDFETANWLTPHSDIVALMVLEHQTQMHNRFTQANFAVRRAIHATQSAESQPDSAETAPTLETTINQAAKLVVDYLLFVDEAKLESPVRGSNSFAIDFSRRGQRDSQGRSLRDFDLDHQLFRYPCSYLINGSAFSSLEPALLQRVYQQLHAILMGQNQAPEYDHLSPQSRADILSILRETKTDLPDYWSQS
ncbi:hypothetical protein NHH03_11125 [Stieleria sp. TO1_6]|uniref:hypothetical protein n=1 Tax=Stieleria tagensis TaxID=2956795 RepID=UPI00209AD7DF|nr:hypothetical protein [Stieleria tagensis]MCO8122292.1 hypothetical protein [Stieleria tagensis]